MVLQLYYVHLPKSICLMDGNGLKRLSVQSDKGRKYPSRKSVSFTFFYHIYLTVVETNEYNFKGASTLLHISSLIDRLMQVHVGFFIRWRRKGEDSELDGCFAKQPPHRSKFRTMRQFSQNYMSCCHTTHNIFFFFAQITEYYIFIMR